MNTQTESVRTARAALGQTMLADRKELIIAVACLAVALSPFLVFQGIVEDIGLIDVALLLVGLAAMICNFAFLPKREFYYQRLRLLTLAAGVLLLCWLANALLGPAAQALCDDRLPWVTPLLVAAPAYFHSYQLQQDANRMSFGFIICALLIYALHWVLIADHGLTASEIWLGQALSLGICHALLLLHLQTSIQGVLRDQLMREVNELEAEVRDLEARSLRSATTHS